MKIRVCDFETTGTEPTDAICQIGQTDVMLDDDGRGAPVICTPCAMFTNPGRPIPPEARAIHHIRARDIEHAAPIDIGLLQLMEGRGKPDVFCAHNAKFERQFFAGGDIPWICTRKVAMRVWPEAPNFQNQTLRYFLDVDSGPHFYPENAMPPHRAGPDTYVTAHILARAIMLGTPIEDMIRWSNEPSLLPGVINFGTKQKGVLWSLADGGYLDWIARTPDMDEDKKFTAKYWLERRRVDAR